MQLIREEYTSKDGKKVRIERFIGKKEQCILSTTRKALTPMVSDITFDEEHDVFLIRDEFSDIENGKKGTNRANVFFYIDFDGNPIETAFCDAFDGFFPVQTRGDGVDKKDRWFTGYGTFKRELGIKLGEELKQRKDTHNNELRKVLANNKIKEVN